jgi:hypothetical protein
MVEPLRHRQTKEAETDMFYLKPPRHISTLPRLCENALPGRVKTQTPNLRVEFPSRFGRCRNQMHRQLLSEEGN